MIRVGNFYVKKDVKIGDKIKAFRYSDGKKNKLDKIVAFNGKELELIDLPKGVF